MRRAPWVAPLLLVAASSAAVLHPRAAEAQRGPAGAVSADLLVAVPRGEFGRHVDTGFGAEVEGRHFLGTGGWFALRAHGGYLEYARTRDWTCAWAPVGCRVELAVATASSIAFGGIGPELAIPGPVSPYVQASAGVAYFSTSSSLEDHWGADFGRTTYFSDVVPSLQAGGGVRVRLRGGRFPLALDLGALYHRNGEVDYVRPQDVTTAPDGTLVLYPVRSEADLVTYRVGVSVGLSSGGDRDGRDGRRGGRRRR